MHRKRIKIEIQPREHGTVLSLVFRCLKIRSSGATSDDGEIRSDIGRSGNQRRQHRTMGEIRTSGATSDEAEIGVGQQASRPGVPSIAWRNDVAGLGEVKISNNED
jgi:hypothetical protein